MKKIKNISIPKKKILIPKTSNIFHFENKLNIREKLLSTIDYKINGSLFNLNNIFSKLSTCKNTNESTQLVSDDMNSLKFLTHNRQYSNRILKMNKNISNLIDAYNLGINDLDSFMIALEKKPKISNSNNEEKNNGNISKRKKDIENLDFNIANIGKTKRENKFNNYYLHNEKKLRKINNLKFEILFRDKLKQVYNFDYYNAPQKTPLTIKDTTKIKKLKKTKSRYFNIYEKSNDYNLNDLKSEMISFFNEKKENIKKLKSNFQIEDSKKIDKKRKRLIKNLKGIIKPKKIEKNENSNDLKSITDTLSSIFRKSAKTRSTTGERNKRFNYFLNKFDNSKNNNI